MKRSAVSSTAPQMPMVASVGTSATAKVDKPMSSSDAMSVDLRPMRSP